MDYKRPAIHMGETTPQHIYTYRQRQRMAEIVNCNLNGSEFETVVGTLCPGDFSDSDFGTLIVMKSTYLDVPDTLLNAFSSTARDRRQDDVCFYHFLKYGFALRAVKENALQFTAMKYFEDNDHAEYSEFLRRCGYCKDGVDGDKRKLFVLCLTNTCDSERFWREYADDDKGVCLCLRLSDFNLNTAEFWDFRDVVYDDGRRFSFIRNVRDEFLREFDREFYIDGVDKFARFYKRQKYEWETETRITLDFRLHQCLVNEFPIHVKKDAQGKNTREFIVVPFKNGFYTLTLDEITCGYEVTESEMEVLRAASGLPQDRVEKRAR